MKKFSDELPDLLKRMGLKSGIKVKSTGSFNLVNDSVIEKKRKTPIMIKID